MNRLRYLPRLLAPVVENALRLHPVVVVSGARQTGKTTLVHHLRLASKRSFHSLDDLDALELARKRPEDLLARGKLITIDEVQRVPGLLLAIKQDVDRSRRRGRFLLTGSANLLLMREVADSLSGRAVYLVLSPMTVGEKRGHGTAPAWSQLLACKGANEALEVAGTLPSAEPGSWRREAMRGGLPPAALARINRERSQWLDGFIQTYLERDLRDISQVASLPDFRRLMRLAAHRIGGILNQADLGRDAALAQATAHRYINLLETTFQLVRLPVYATNPSKRLIKAPKVYWMDSGLAAHLAGFRHASQLASSTLAGPFLENLVLMGLLAWRETSHPRPEVSYWRTAGGAEIDFVIELVSRILPVEVKASSKVVTRDVRHLEIFLDDYRRRSPWGLVLYDGSEARRITRRIVAVPVTSLL